jgi:hypothetical protein
MGNIYAPLLNADKKWYGTLIGITEHQIRDLLAKEGVELSLVLLSSHSATWVMGAFKRQKPCFDVTSFQSDAYITFGVMLVRSDVRPFRRLAIDEVHHSQRENLDPQPDLIWLA